MRFARYAPTATLLAVSAWAGCTSSPRTGTPIAAEIVDAGAEKIATPQEAPPTFAEAGAPAAQNCERDLDVGELSISGETCFVNQHVANQTAKLEFPCAGGKAVATFGTHVFEGTVKGDVIDLVNVEPFVWYSCDWISTETIKGDLGAKTVTYSYSEKPKTTCPEPPCTAGGTLDVTAGDVVIVK